MSTVHVTKTRFCIDSLENETFEGFTDGSDWNGWACPYFTRQVAETVLKASEKNGYKYSYDEQNDAFVVTNIEDPEDYEPEVFAAVKLSVEGEEITTYGIGAYYWIWETC